MTMHAEREYDKLHCELRWYTTPRDGRATLAITTPMWDGKDHVSSVSLPIEIWEWVTSNFREQRSDMTKPTKLFDTPTPTQAVITNSQGGRMEIERHGSTVELRIRRIIDDARASGDVYDKLELSISDWFMVCRSMRNIIGIEPPHEKLLDAYADLVSRMVRAGGGAFRMSQFEIEEQALWSQWHATKKEQQ